MRLQLTNQEAATLTLHMSLMRKTIKKTAKRQSLTNPTMASYDYVHSIAKSVLMTELDGHIDLNVKDVELINNFLLQYNKLMDGLDMINDLDKEQVLHLRNVQHKTTNLLMSHA